MLRIKGGSTMHFDLTSLLYRPANFWRILAGSLCLCAGPTVLQAQNADPFEDFIRKTDPLTPAQEQKAFHLPPGFEIQLVASEPEIGKPMNLAFDEKGRMWITQSREYPFPAPSDQPARDTIKILSQFQLDGRAVNVSTFATNLNIPIGIYPYKGGAIAFSIPYIHYYQDTDGDGKADKEDVILGRFGFDRDTHGLTSAFRRGYDGWIYADHGFNNNTTLTARDGSSITMNSGNCYRFQVDGSKVEQHSWGQVNPFGLMFDPLGDLWSADCHSSPVYVLLRGAYYPSFGKPDDGLGFGPHVITHQHGSTAIAGMVYYAATNFPAEYRANTFIGNVMTCRINRDSYVEHGSTRPGKEEPDFLRCDDPWFRPVDLQLGPDGAIYIADFYNRIIGHYEVPLDHPGRDRERGRIWRIVYTGKQNGSPAPQLSNPQDFDLSKATVDQVIARLGDSNITARQLAMNHLVDNLGPSVVPAVSAMMKNPSANAFQKLHGLWVLHRLGGVDAGILSAAAKDSDRLVRTHAMRVLSETTSFNEMFRQLAVAGLTDTEAFVQRAAADALGRHPQFENIAVLLELLRRIPADDVQLRHMVRMSLRNQLIPPGTLARLQNPSEADSRAVADVAVAVSSEDSGAFLLQHIQKYSEPRETLNRYLRHVARYLPAAQMDALAEFTRAKFADDVELQVTLFKSVQEGMAQRGVSGSARFQEWGADLAKQLLTVAKADAVAWYNTPLDNFKDSANPWSLQTRNSADGNKAATFLSSLPTGETLTGILRSQPFAIPAQFAFFMAGHDGYPDKAPQKKNGIRLRAMNGDVLAESWPPRNDLAQPFSWDLQAHAGERGYLEIIDGDNAGAYAWLAVGRFTPSVVSMPAFSPNQFSQRLQTAAELARSLHLKNLAADFGDLLLRPGLDLNTRGAAARTLAELDPNDNVVALAPLAGDASVPAVLREQIAQVLVNRSTHDSALVLVEAFRTTPYRIQLKMAQSLAGSRAGAAELLRLMEQGQASPTIILDRNVKDKLASSKPERMEERITRLSHNLTPASEQVQKLIEQRRGGFGSSKPSAVTGAQVFAKNCAVCHTIDGKGGLVGPQLEGIGGRGLERLLEDVLDPNRSVDVAFRTHVITLKDGDVLSGLPRREEGELLVLADSTGKEITIPKKDIQSRRESETSLMPENFGDVIPADEFNHLLAFLLAHGPSQSVVK